MAKSDITTKHLTQQFLIDQFSAFEKNLKADFEKRLQHQLDIQTETLKEYVDFGFRQVDERFKQIDERFRKIDVRLDQIDQRLDKIQNKLSVNTDGLVEMITRMTGKLDDKLENHEARIVALEQRKN